MKSWSKIYSFILVMAILLTAIPIAPIFAAGEPSITLGSASLADGKYSYPNATISGENIRTILISFSDSVTSGDAIVLPSTTPSGFTVSQSSSSNVYAKRINLAENTSASAIADYVRGIRFSIESATQSLSITVTTENIANDTFYNSDTGHYYQYIADTSSNWTSAYDTAKAMTYMGRTGYLATITSAEEDKYVNSLSGGKTGWLGGTLLSNTGTTSGSLYYNGFDTSSVVSTGWYWACGPEKGTTFYSSNSLYPSVNAENATTVDSANTAYYYNWARGTVSYEPNNMTLYQSSTENDFEACLTTLVISGNTGKQGTSFSWNDKRYDTAGSGMWDAKGYFVEYGNQMEGDSGSASTAFSTATATLKKPSAPVSLTTVSWTGASTYTCGVSLPATSKMVTISVDSGYFTIPSLGSALTFLGGTNGTSYVSSYNANTHFSSAVFSFTDYVGAANLLGNIVYSISGSTPQTISATSSTISPLAGDIYFEGHYYRYVDSGTASINWPSSVLAAGATDDPYFGGRGYIATATSQAENSILLRLVENGLGGSDHWDDAWMGGMWQRNEGTVASPTIIRGTDGNEITYDDLYQCTNLSTLLKDYSDTFSDLIISNPSTFIYSNPSTVRYYWVDGPEAGQEIANNSSDFSPWHTTSGTQDEPNAGDFVYIGWQGAYWDDLSAGSNFDKLSGYIVEFSGFDGGSDAGIIMQDSKTTTAYTATVNTRINASAGAAPGAVDLRQSGSSAITMSQSSTGVYTKVVHPGTYDVYINGEDTGKDITITSADAALTVDYYTVSYSVSDAGEASGSTISATADETGFTSGSAILAGKEIVITAVGAGATQYTYAWSGTGIEGGSLSSVSVSSLGAAVNAHFTVTGTILYSAIVNTKIDGIQSDIEGTVELRKGAIHAEAVDFGTGVYRASVQTGTYDVYIDGHDTGINIYVLGTGSSTVVNYYTVSFSIADEKDASGSTISATADGAAITNGVPVLAGKAIQITVLGAGATVYEYSWSQESGNTNSTSSISSLDHRLNAICTVTGTRIYTPIVTFDAEGGSLSISSQVKRFGCVYGKSSDGTTAEPLPIPSRDGYTFSGWWTGYNGTGIQAAENTSVSSASDHTLYAKWTPVTLAVTPTARPTEQPTATPTEQPTAIPTAQPTEQPTATPTVQPVQRTASIVSGGMSSSLGMNRTTSASGSVVDQAILTTDAMQALLDQGTTSDEIAIMISEDENAPADGYTFDIPSGVLFAIASSGRNTVLDSPFGSVTLSEESMSLAAGNKTPLSLSFMTDKAASSEEVFSTLQNMTGRVLGTPILVKTNIDSLALSVTLPLDGFSEDELADEAFLDSVCVYVTYEDNKTDVLFGTIVYTDGVPTGICFEMNQSGSYQIISAVHAKPINQKGEPAENGNWTIWIMGISGGILLVGIFFLILLFKRRKNKEEAEQSSQNLLNL